MADLERVRARAAAASDGLWQRHGSDVWLEGSPTPLFTGRDGSAETRRRADADAEFVARARQDITDLLAVLDEQATPSSARQQPDHDAPTTLAAEESPMASRGVV